MKKRSVIAGAVAVVAVGAAGTGVAVAVGGDDDGPASHQYTDQQRDDAIDAALEATGGGEANSVETDDENGATYEVEVTKDAEDEWVDLLLSGPGRGVIGSPDCTPGYYNNEGQPPGPASNFFVGYPYGPTAYFAYIDQWRSSGEFEGLALRRRY